MEGGAQSSSRSRSGSCTRRGLPVDGRRLRGAGIWRSEQAVLLVVLLLLMFVVVRVCGGALGR